MWIISITGSPLGETPAFGTKPGAEGGEVVEARRECVRFLWRRMGKKDPR